MIWPLNCKPNWSAIEEAQSDGERMHKVAPEGETMPVAAAGAEMRASSGRRGSRWRLRSEEWHAFGFVLPLVALEFLLVVIPLALSFYYSLYRVDYFELTQFRGFGNYWRVLTSPMVQASLIATVIFSLGALILTLTLGMALALHLERDSR